MFSPFGNGHHPGATPGTWKEPGDRSLARVPGPGGRRVAPGKAGQLASQRGEAWAGPLHLIRGGALSDSGGPGRLCWHRHGTPAAAGMRHRDGPQSSLGTARSLAGGGSRWLVGLARQVPARECGSAGWVVTGRGARADRGGQPCRVRMSMTGRRAVDTRAACAVSGGGHRCLVARSHPRRRVLASGVWACHEAPVR